MPLDNSANSGFRRYSTLGEVSAAAEHLPKATKHKLSEEEHEFVLAKIKAGLTDIEVSRMFFRKFGQRFTAAGVHHIRKRETP